MTPTAERASRQTTRVIRGRASTICRKAVPLRHDSTFVFADLAGFTALTEAHGDEDAADLAVEFAHRLRQRLGGLDGELVKTIGDAAMIRMDSAGSAVALGLEIVSDLMGDHGQPTVRVGMHAGPASERDGDFFGATVNIAARITGLAGGGQVLLSAAVHDAAVDVEGVRFEPLGERRLRNATRPLHLYTAVRDSARPTMLVDPVCRMAIAPGRESQRITHADTVYVFCSPNCADRFLAQPEAYTLHLGS